MDKKKFRKNRFGSAPAKSTYRLIMDFLNTSLGIWLISTVFISFGTWTYSKWSENRKFNIERERRIHDLDTEIKERFATVAAAIRRNAYGSGEYVLKGQEVLLIYDGVMGPASDANSVFFEFQKRGLRSLIIELKSNLSSDEALCMKYALKKIVALREMHDIAVKDMAAEIESIADYRWSDSAELDTLGYQIAPEPTTNAELAASHSRKIFCGSYVLTVGVYEQ